MVSTPEVGNEKIPISPSQSVTVKNPGAIKLLSRILEALDVKHKTDLLRLGAAQSKRESIIAGNCL